MSKSIDDETTELTDVYDSLVAPKTIWRNHDNKLYLILRSFAAGKVGLVDAAIALHNKFNPLYCDDVDLYSTAKLVGTDFKEGTGSVVNITIINKNATEQKNFPAGIYNYQSVMGTVFSFRIPNDYLFLPEEALIVAAISAEKGSFPVAQNMNIKLHRSDSEKIDSNFVFSCEDNSGQLGYEDETPYDFRTRILSDANRQDHIRELELKIRNLPGIFECNLVMNESVNPQEYDGIILASKELLVTITGVPTDAIARLVAGEVLYATHQVDPDNVVYYYNDLFLSGKYPVYFTYHNTTDFSLAISYEYDQNKLNMEQVENAIEALFKPYAKTTRHLDIFSEGDAYKILENLSLPNVKILNVDVLNSACENVAFVKIPKTRLPRLTEIIFSAVEAGGQM